ncbi:MAG: hypothetical protein MUF49_20285 [Oculatellaceae cyanobacterium Prado106]|jgi:hypothetical protein|nr:hypothetical protein [Oculatellaceae cyanobacterium Prado106]
MDSSFWLQRWERNEIGFHKKDANPLLVKYFGEHEVEGGLKGYAAQETVWRLQKHQ